MLGTIPGSINRFKNASGGEGVPKWPSMMSTCSQSAPKSMTCHQKGDLSGVTLLQSAARLEKSARNGLMASRGIAYLRGLTEQSLP
jgi:hypothetical protein